MAIRNIESIKFKTGTLAQLEALALSNGIIERFIYVLTDIESIAIGTGVDSYKIMNIAEGTQEQLATFLSDGSLGDSGFTIEDTAEATANTLWSVSKVIQVEFMTRLQEFLGDVGYLLPSVQTIAELRESSTQVNGLILVEDSGLYRFSSDTLDISNDDGNMIVFPNGSNINDQYWVKIASNTYSHTQFNGLQGDDEYHLTEAQHIEATQYANSTDNGVLASGDWEWFNNKLGETDDVVFNEVAPISEVITFNPEGGAYSAVQTVELSNMTDPVYEARIVYATGGEEPNEYSLDYDGPITISSSTTIKSAVVINNVLGEVHQAIYTLNLAGDGYIMAGRISNGNRIRHVDKLSFTTYTRSTIYNLLQQIRYLAGGCHSSDNGYIVGGYISSSTTDIDSITFDTNTLRVNQTALSTARYPVFSIPHSRTNAYIFMSSNTLSLDKLNYSDDSIYTQSNYIGINLRAAGRFCDNDYGYTMGGCTTANLNTINSVRFSDDSLTMNVATLPVSFSNRSYLNSETHGYTYMEGTSGMIIKIALSNLSITTKSINYTAKHYTSANVSDKYFGFTCGGEGFRSSITRITYSDDTISNSGISLSSGLEGPSGAYSSGLL